MITSPYSDHKIRMLTEAREFAQKDMDFCSSNACEILHNFKRTTAFNKASQKKIISASLNATKTTERKKKNSIIHFLLFGKKNGKIRGCFHGEGTNLAIGRSESFTLFFSVQRTTLLHFTLLCATVATERAVA